MNTIAADHGKRPASRRLAGRNHHGMRHQRGMGATIILFTIALIVLVGAALAYASRGNPSAIGREGAKVYTAVLLKQSAEYRDAFSRFVFDGGNAGTMTFNATGLPPGDLFNPAAQLGTYQAPPPQVTTTPTATALWKYNNNIVVTGVGTGGSESLTYVTGLTLAACQAVNNQMYGTTSVPTTTIAAAALATGGTVVALTPSTADGRASGCFQDSAAADVFYSSLGES